jgi:hypothetical protein
MPFRLPEDKILLTRLQRLATSLSAWTSKGDVMRRSIGGDCITPGLLLH